MDIPLLLDLWKYSSLKGSGRGQTWGGGISPSPLFLSFIARLCGRMTTTTATDRLIPPGTFSPLSAWFFSLLLAGTHTPKVWKQATSISTSLPGWIGTSQHLSILVLCGFEGRASRHASKRWVWPPCNPIGNELVRGTRSRLIRYVVVCVSVCPPIYISLPVPLLCFFPQTFSSSPTSFVFLYTIPSYTTYIQYTQLHGSQVKEFRQ